MNATTTLLAWLARTVEAHPTALTIASSALRYAAGDYRSAICTQLRALNQPEANAALLANIDRLDPALRQELLEDETLVRSALAVALPCDWPEAKHNVLEICRTQFVPTAAPYLGHLLLDDDRNFSTDAAELLRDYAGLLEDAPNWADPGRRTNANSVADALRDALYRFEKHAQLPAFQAALWVARDIGDPLWTALKRPDGMLRHIIFDQLRRWDSPQLASFYLGSLLRGDLSHDVSRLFAKWKSAEALTALLKHADLLEPSRERRPLGMLRAVNWFDDLPKFLMQLPQELRVRLPQVLVCLGLPEAEAIRVLDHWRNAPCERLRRGALYALGWLGNAGAKQQLASISGNASTEGQFATWVLAAKDAPKQVRTAPASNTNTPTSTANKPAASTSAGQGSDQPATRQPQVTSTPNSSGSRFVDSASVAGDRGEFVLLWELTRRSEPQLHLVEILRDHFGWWSESILTRLRSPVSGDRLLALQILATEALLQRFSDHVRETLNDPNPTIRAVGQRLLRILANPDQPLTKPPTGPLPGSEPPPIRVHNSVEEIQEAIFEQLTLLLARDANRIPVTPEEGAQIAILFDRLHVAASRSADSASDASTSVPQAASTQGGT